MIKRDETDEVWLITTVKIRVASQLDSDRLQQATILIDDEHVCDVLPDILTPNQTVEVQCKQNLGILGSSIKIVKDINAADKYLSFKSIEVYGYHLASLQDPINPGRPGKSISIDVDSNGRAYAINTQGYMFKYDAQKWRRILGLGRNIGVMFSNEIWVISKDYDDTITENGELYKSID